MDDITKEELLRAVPLFILVFMTYAFLWNATGQKIPAVWAPVISLVATAIITPLRIWYRHRRGW